MRCLKDIAISGPASQLKDTNTANHGGRSMDQIHKEGINSTFPIARKGSEVQQRGNSFQSLRDRIWTFGIGSKVQGIRSKLQDA
ncbi:hypothetical protein DEO72_LG9g1852 [Vigna unguiculata]|uniref:Uncharacterized protein n=1 Tax=Vigna unguiculata TaxID=3917 RepID=A0A4D6N0N4_VIGUN|nr:hypothetical protein DEO72_LG9g1852 [Vigna unguiculata]